MSWDVAVEILEGRSEYNSWEYAYIRDAIRNNCSKGSQAYEYYRMKLYDHSGKDELYSIKCFSKALGNQLGFRISEIRVDLL